MTFLRQFYISGMINDNKNNVQVLFSTIDTVIYLTRSPAGPLGYL